MNSAPIDVRERPPYSANQFDIKDEYEAAIDTVLLSGGEIDSRIARLAAEISHDYRTPASGELYAVCILKGALQFFGSLTPQLDVPGPLSEGVIRAHRYAAGECDSVRADIRFLEPDLIEGKDILVVEDIIDEGYTLQTILAELEQYNPNSVEIAVLFDKVARREADVEIAYTGFLIPDKFVVGYGLDYQERYRNLRHLAVLDESAL